MCHLQAPHELEVDEHFRPETVAAPGEEIIVAKSTPVTEPHPIELLPGETVKADEEFDGELRAILTDYRVRETQCSWLSYTPPVKMKFLFAKNLNALIMIVITLGSQMTTKGSRELSPTYPEYMVIPKEISHKDLVDGKDFRFLQRWPAVVWKCKETRAVLLRSSQPRLSLFGWRNNADEKFFELVHKYLDTYSPGKDMLIMDARSYAAAWANRAKGGGFEHPEYYQRTRVDWLALPNIHNVRYSFHQLRALLCSNQNKTGESYLTVSLLFTYA
ncbi:hypothetical protein ANCDUO_06410 [Ancylostoma duodenale]|uniref:Myotubularin phosphatase domain-containing protein n=1 Tax=Ancylostoma duodenale TaxID=51022 RepID=A0A0C2D1P0_9BILA|nr:hypothetical protein ANCDUO_06410 [Ancylostoma duodenale]